MISIQIFIDFHRIVFVVWLTNERRFRDPPIEDTPNKPLIPKICHKFSRMMKLVTVIPYLMKIKKKNMNHVALNVHYGSL